MASLVEVQKVAAPVLRKAEKADTRLENALRAHQRLTSAATALYPDAAFTDPAPTGKDAFQWRDDVMQMMETPLPTMIFLPPDPAEVERNELRRQRDIEREKNGETGGVLHGGYAHVVGAHGA